MHCGSFWNYNGYRSEILQTCLGWYSALPQYISENSVEPLDFGETLKLKNGNFSRILRELCGSSWNYYSCSPTILQTSRAVFFIGSHPTKPDHKDWELRQFSYILRKRCVGFETIKAAALLSCRHYIKGGILHYLNMFQNMAQRPWWLLHSHGIHLSVRRCCCRCRCRQQLWKFLKL